MTGRRVFHGVPENGRKAKPPFFGVRPFRRAVQPFVNTVTFDVRASIASYSVF
jgi:hypothetical protein